MQLVRFALHDGDAPRTGLHVDGVVHDLTERFPTLASFTSAFPDGWTRDAATGGAATHRLADVVLLPPIDNASTLYLVGANYRKHADEAGLSVPQTPVFFSKPASALVAHGRPIELPPISHEMDYEGELAVVLGRRARRVSKDEARRCVCGYTIVNDVTARDWQQRHLQWHLGKSFDTYCPMGPWLVSADECDATRTGIRCYVNGEERQNANTADLIFDIPTLIETLSAGITLYPGDVIATGTPVGVGIGFKPPKYLKPGDVVRVEIDGIGALQNPVR
jgi:2-keto-4-pentenoate hydratase/2-oxohepta-3-ene-1,7-dioic acid hydratase in catechol pathway